MKYADIFFQKSNYLILSLSRLIYNSSELRIVNFFKSMARDYGHDINGLPGLKSIPIQLTYLEIARLTSTTPEKVLSVLDQLRDQGVIMYAEDKVFIKY